MPLSGRGELWGSHSVGTSYAPSSHSCGKFSPNFIPPFLWQKNWHPAQRDQRSLIIRFSFPPPLTKTTRESTLRAISLSFTLLKTFCTPRVEHLKFRDPFLRILAIWKPPSIPIPVPYSCALSTLSFFFWFFSPTPIHPHTKKL